MKTIKLNTYNMKKSLSNLLKERFLYRLQDEFEFEYCDNPDFLFVGDQNKNFDYLNKNSVLIFFSIENMHPDFELYDYCIGYNSDLFFGDRFCFYLPAFGEIYNLLPEDLKFKQLTREEAYNILQNKDLFCDFTYNHDNVMRSRQHYLNLLNTYKDVTIGGRLYNPNISNFKKSYNYSDKLELQKRCKFSIVVESCEYSGGLVTEKIFHAILSNTIPIYYGEKDVAKYINPKRFIDAKKYDDDELLELIKTVDNNDMLYLDYLCQPPLVDEDFFSKNQERLICFLRNIFSQKPENAFRKPYNEFTSGWYKTKLIKADHLYNAGVCKTTRHLIKLIFTKIKRKIGSLIRRKHPKNYGYIDH